MYFNIKHDSILSHMSFLASSIYFEKLDISTFWLAQLPKYTWRIEYVSQGNKDS
jgi:hypothetical protein